ncbi:MAG: tetratricopeptide repeat protein [Patescibacteria group bacterium]
MDINNFSAGDIRTMPESAAFQPALAIKILNTISSVCLYLVVFLMPLWFLPQTLDVLELNKQTLLAALTMIALLCHIGAAILERRMTITRSWMHLVVLMFGLGYLVTSLFSEDRYLSMVGNFGQMQWAFASIACFVVLYFILVNKVRSTSFLYHLILAFLGSAVVAALYGILQINGAYALGWLFPALSAKTFNTVGTLNSLGVFLSVAIVLASSLMVLGCKDQKCVLGRSSKGSLLAKILVWVAILLPLVYVAMIDFWVCWAAILFGTLLLVAISTIRTRAVKHPIKLIVPGLICAVSVIFLIWSTPFKLSLPAEVAPSMTHSWDIAKQALRSNPVFGTGPGTWIYDYSQYRSPSVNTSPFWTYRFERGYSTFLTLLPTIGLVGITLWLMLVISAIVKSILHLLKEKDDDQWQAYLTVFVGWATVVFSAFFYNYNLAHHFLFWFLLGLLGTLVARGKFNLDGQAKPAYMGLLSIIFILVTVGSVSVLWLSGQRLVADADYSKAVLTYRDGKPIQQSIDKLNSAVALNSLNDAYYRNLSQAYLIQLNEKIVPNPNADQAKEISALVSASVDTARKATEVSPKNVDNWSNLAVIYQSIASFTRGADEFAIKNFQEAAKLEPNNPTFADEIGKIYIMRADAYATLLNTKDEKARADAQTKMVAELDHAAEYLNQAVQLKGDFALAHYNLAIMYERQNKLPEAIAKMELVLAADSTDVGVGFQLGLLYYRNNQKDKARDLFEQIVAYEPKYSNARWFLAALYEEGGRLDDAIAQVKKVQELNPGNQTVDERLAALLKLKEEKAKPTTTPIPEPVKEQIQGPKPLNEVQK